MMKALTLWQPWASLWAHGVKIHETRSWALADPPPLLAVHAAKKWNRELAEIALADPFLDHLIEIPSVSFPNGTPRMPRGSVVGVVEIEAVIATSELQPGPVEAALGDFSAGRFAWRARTAHPLRMPIPCPGAQGVWTLPPEIEREVRAELDL